MVGIHHRDPPAVAQRPKAFDKKSCSITSSPTFARNSLISLPQGQVEDEPERQRGFDGEIGILPLPATFADAHGLPSGDRIRGQPHGDIASLDQRSVVCRPIPDVVFCLYFGCTLDFMSRSCTCCRHDGQEVDRGSPRARDPCTNADIYRWCQAIHMLT